jgi:glutamyl-tRNA synthetase
MIITRIAPTPSGYLHQGNAFNFLLNWLLARSQRGKVLLRIDDLDAPRAKPEFINDVFETLDWLGIDYDIGPIGPDDLAAAWSQSHRLPLYHELLDNLKEHGHLFACECSRKDLADSSGVYPGTCLHKNIALDTPDVAWRINVEADAVIYFTDCWQGAMQYALGQEMGSFVVRRRDGIPAYQIASLADDVHFGVSAMARGMDLLPSTAGQLYLAQLLGIDSFTQTQFYHHPLIMDNTGQKLSKSAGSVSLNHWRSEGIPAGLLLANFCKWAGIEVDGEVQNARELLSITPKSWKF